MIKVAEDKETTPAEATLTTWSFGRRLQSASVSSFPSRNLRVDSPSSASSGRGLIRYSSSLARALFRLASKAKTHRKHYHRILKEDKPNYRHISWVLHAHLDFYPVLCFWQKLKIWQICHFLLCWIHDSLLQVWGTWQNSRTLFRVVTWPIYQSLFVCVWDLLRWSQLFLQEFLYFVDIRVNFPFESEEGRVCPRSQVVKISWFPD